jgi:hypothetical protein
MTQALATVPSASDGPSAFPRSRGKQIKGYRDTGTLRIRTSLSSLVPKISYRSSARTPMATWRFTTILMTMANLVPWLREEEIYLALYQGVTRVADDCQDEVPRRENHPLDTNELDFATLKRWFRYWTQVRHRDAAERTLLIAIARRFSRKQIAEIVLAAATDRYYADSGHAAPSRAQAIPDKAPLANITRLTVSLLLRPRLKSVHPGSTT